ncbi:MAG: hypothetical protein HZC17_08455 [Candidatus Omnitrophica bacterium]|nr:hypothetical protein [Candidatus Omnitrophota bacterium]
MKNTAVMVLTLLLITGCASTPKPFPEGAKVEVTEWQILRGADGKKTLEGAVSNNSPYLVYNVDLITQVYEGTSLKQELTTRLPNLLPDSRTRFELLLPTGPSDPRPVFDYHFQFTREEQSDESRRSKRFGIGPIQMQTSASTWKYQAPREETFDSRSQ